VPLLRKGVKPIDAARGFRLFFLFLSLWGPFGVWRASQKIEQNTDVLRYPSTTQGEITYVRLTGRGAPTLEYAYEVMGKKYNGVTEPDVRPNYWQDPHVGDLIEVSFSIKHPSWSMAGDPKRQPDYGLSVDLSWAFLVIGLIGLVVSQWAAIHLKKSEVTQNLPMRQSRQQRRELVRKQRKLLK
jgi:hypothetical protein